MTNQEAKMAWANGKKLEYRHVNWDERSWVALDRANPLAIFDDPNYQFRIAQEPIVLECVVRELGGSKAVYCGEGFVTWCRDLGIDPPLGAKVKVTVEVE